MDFDSVTPERVETVTLGGAVEYVVDDGTSLAGVGAGSAIDIDTRSLRSFAALIEADLNGTIRPYTDRLLSTFSAGVGFGLRNPGDDLQAAIATYHDCLASTTQQLAAIVNAATILVDAACQIATEYASADALSGATTAKVTQALTFAITAAAAGKSVV